MNEMYDNEAHLSYDYRILSDLREEIMSLTFFQTFLCVYRT